MNILVIGQCSLHWGRMEYGNIGNYYVIEPFFRELHRVFPGARVRTTFQMSDEFCQQENVLRLPLDLYYSWSDDDLGTCLKEYGSSVVYAETGRLPLRTRFMDEVLASDLVIDFSGDMWGDNADMLGSNRFLIGCYKVLTAKQLGKPVAMLAGSPGPFRNEHNLAIARAVLPRLDLVTHREGVSSGVLRMHELVPRRELSLACPAFLFQAAPAEEVQDIIAEVRGAAGARPIVGVALCGWNFAEGPFDRWPRDDDEYRGFCDLVEHLVRAEGATILLFSHSNGFKTPPDDFEFIHGRDYPIIKQLQRILNGTSARDHVHALDGIYSPHQTKAIIRELDMVVSGRVHAAVAAMSEAVPTVIINYANGPQAHKLEGFASLAGMSEYLANPTDLNDLIQKASRCTQNRDSIRATLTTKIPEVQRLARGNFEALADLVER